MWALEGQDHNVDNIMVTSKQWFKVQVSNATKTVLGTCKRLALQTKSQTDRYAHDQSRCMGQVGWNIQIHLARITNLDSLDSIFLSARLLGCAMTEWNPHTYGGWFVPCYLLQLLWRKSANPKRRQSSVLAPFLVRVFATTTWQLGNISTFRLLVRNHTAITRMQKSYTMRTVWSICIIRS